MLFKYTLFNLCRLVSYTLRLLSIFLYYLSPLSDFFSRWICITYINSLFLITCVPCCCCCCCYTCCFCLLALVVGVVACTELERVGVACAAIYIIKCLLLSAIGIFFILFKRRFLYEFSAMRGPPAHEAKTRHQLIALSLSSHTHTRKNTISTLSKQCCYSLSIYDFYWWSYVKRRSNSVNKGIRQVGRPGAILNIFILLWTHKTVYLPKIILA